MGGGGMGGGGFRGGGGGFVGNRGGFVGNRGGFVGNRGFVGNGFRGFGFRGGWPYWWAGYGLGYGYGGYGYGYWPGYYDAYDYPGYSYPAYSYASPAYSYQGYQQQPSNVTVVYPPENQQTVVERVNPVIREYDQYGQQVGGGGPSVSGSTTPALYLIAFRDHTIRAAVAYWVEGNTLHFVTAEHESKTATLDAIDRELSRQINNERHVQFSLPNR